MPDWIIAALSGLQRTAVSSLAAEMRAGGALTAVLAFGLGAVHALTPGHGKSALAAYFLGQDARLATGVRVALTAALIHVAMGFLAFLVLRLVVGQLPAMTARGSPAFALIGYGLILVAGSIMICQSLRPAASEASPHVLTAGVGILPCPLTITVLGFAWAQGSGPMVAVVMVALAAGIAFTIGVVAALAIAGRQLFGYALMHRMPALERGARALQGVAGAAIVVIAAYALWANL